MNLKMRRLTWFMRKHSEGKAHWDDEERPWNPFLLSDVRRDGAPFVFIIHHASIVFQSVNGRRAVAICMLMISLAAWSRNPGGLRVWEFSYPCPLNWLSREYFCRLVGPSDFQSTQLIFNVIHLLIFSVQIKVWQQVPRRRIWTL